MTNVQQSKSILAKLLATENLIVEHRSVPTASFDVHNRILVLPIFKEMSGDVYDLLVGHEVGHALFTPDVLGSDVGIPMSYLNVCEDARIEKLMKRKFPGLSKCFYKGYNTLNEQDFFEIKDTDVNKMRLIDRINLFFKIGNVNSSMYIQFSEKEQNFVDLLEKCETFDEVVDIARQLADYEKENMQKEDVPTANLIPPDDASGENMQTDNPSDFSTEEGESMDDTADSPSNNQQPQEESTEDSNGDAQKSEDTYDNLEASTDTAWEKNQSQLVSKSAKEYVYLIPPNKNWSTCTISTEKFGTDLDGIIAEFKEDNKNYYSYGNESITIWNNKFEQYKKDSAKSVSYLVKEFEMKKNADEYARSSVAKTGVINTNKLFSYKWSEDIFKKVTVNPGGKSHGLIMYVDWSGSMKNELVGTIKQLFNLIQFCQRVQIPFEVYYFNDKNASRDFNRINRSKLKDGQIIINDDYHLVNMFSSNMNAKQTEQQMRRVWHLVHIISQYYGIPSQYGMYDLGSTPLNDTIFAAVDLFKKFKSTHKVDKVNTVFLTDGESNALTFAFNQTDSKGQTNNRIRLSVWMSDYSLCLRDAKNNYVDLNINKNGEVHLTARLMDYYKQVTNSNVIGFRLIDRYSARNFVNHFLHSEYPSWEKVSEEWSKNKCFTSYTMGFNELYFIELNNEFRGEDNDEINIDVNATRAKIKKEFGKHMSSKMTHKIILSKFVEQIA